MSTPYTLGYRTGGEADARYTCRRGVGGEGRRRGGIERTGGHAAIYCAGLSRCRALPATIAETAPPPSHHPARPRAASHTPSPPGTGVYPSPTHLLGARVPHHVHNLAHGGATHNRIVNQQHAAGHGSGQGSGREGVGSQTREQGGRRGGTRACTARRATSAGQPGQVDSKRLLHTACRQLLQPTCPQPARPPTSSPRTPPASR